jgi:hypothetical protein
MEFFSASTDDRYEKFIELRNQAASLLHSYKATLRDYEELIPDNLKSQAIEKVADLRAAIANPPSEIEAIRQRLNALQKTLLAVNAAIYRYIQQIPCSDNDEHEEWIGRSQNTDISLDISLAMPEKFFNLSDETDFGDEDDCTSLGVRLRVPRQPNSSDDDSGCADQTHPIP